jgi:hypothetical protein
VDLKNEINHWEVPVWIEIVLYKSCAYDLKLVNDIRDKAIRTKIEKDGESLFLQPQVLREVISKRPYSTRLKKQAKMTPVEIAENVDSVYFINNILNALQNLRIVKIFLSNSIFTGRVFTSDDQEVIMLEHSVEYGVLDLPRYFNEKELESFNKTMISLGFLRNKYLLRDPYFKISTTEFLQKLENYITDIFLKDEIDEDDSEMIFLDKLYALIDPKLEEDDTLLLILTDYKNL